MPRPLRRSTAAVLGFALAACSGSGSSSTPIGNNAPPELVACRARIDQPFQFSEIALRDARNLGGNRVGDRAGTERCVRLHPDGVTVVFARERDNADPASREIFTSTTDGSRGELRLTQNTVPDDEPCWSPDGQRILFTAERNGVRGLWLIDAADGANETAFAVIPPGSSDGEAHWSAATDRVVWSRKGIDGRHSLWLGNGTAANPLTDGGPPAGDGAGDRSPCFSPDGQQIVFVRRLGPQLASLCLCDLAGTVTVRLLPGGDVGFPRFSPAQDRLFFGLAEPLAGRQTLRLATVPIASGNPTLVWPDQRWRLDGLDLLPALPQAPVAGTPVTLNVLNAQLQLAAGVAVTGGRAELVAEDNDEVSVLTANFEDRQVAGVNCRFDLPVLLPTDALELQVRVVARSTRADGDSVLRLSIYNPVDERFDTAVEMPAATAPRVMTFATSSLRHVTRERQLRVTVIGDLAPGSQAELRIDAVQVVLVPRQ